jgi:hypothetical protein
MEFKQWLETTISASALEHNPFEAMLSKSKDAWRWVEIYDDAYRKFMRNYQADPQSPAAVQFAQMLSAAQQGNYGPLQKFATSQYRG